MQSDTMPPDLSKITDLDCLRYVAEARPVFIDFLAEQIDRGRKDHEIISSVCKAGGSPQSMRYAAKCLRALRHLQTVNA